MTVVLLVLAAPVISMVIFGLWVGLYFLYRVKFLKEPIALLEIAFLATVYVKRPFFEGFIIGSVAGLVYGLFVGITVYTFNSDKWYSPIFAGILLEIILVVTLLFFADDLNEEMLAATIFLFLFLCIPAATSALTSNFFYVGVNRLFST